MDRKERIRLMRPLLLIFVVTNAIFIIGKSFWLKWNADQTLLIIGNIVVFGATIISLFISMKGIQATNGPAFVRTVYSGMMIKLFSCAIATIVYAVLVKGQYNTPGLLICLFLYMVYTAIEVGILMRLTKQKKNG
jgi:hypothetical protein